MREHTTALEAKTVHKRYSEIRYNAVFSWINLKIRLGENIIIISLSGCGKDTLMNIQYGIEKLTSGEIRGVT